MELIHQTSQESLLLTGEDSVSSMDMDLDLQALDPKVNVQYSLSDKDTPSAKNFCLYQRGVLWHREIHMHSWYFCQEFVSFLEGHPL